MYNESSNKSGGAPGQKEWAGMHRGGGWEMEWAVEEALWTAVSVLGDRDTICAIVGGMVSLFADELPQKWSGHMEHPEDSEFFNYS